MAAITDDDETRRLRDHVRRALRGAPDPDAEQARHELLITAAAQRAAWGIPPAPPPTSTEPQ